MNLRLPAALALALLLAFSSSLSAASFKRASLRDLTQRAKFVADVEVLSTRVIPDDAAGFPRTLYRVVLRQTLAGEAPAEFEFNVPGGEIGGVVHGIAGGVTLQPGERAILFGGEEHPLGGFTVLDLGLGCFKLLEHNGEAFVRSSLVRGAVMEKDRAETAKFFQPYTRAAFDALIAAYARGENPVTPADTLSTPLPATPTALAVHTFSTSTESNGNGVTLGATALLLTPLAFLFFWFRRRRNARSLPGTVATLLLAFALVLGALGSRQLHAFVVSGPDQVWRLEKPLAGRVADGRILWHASTAVSRTNPNVFLDVRNAFNRWDNVPHCRLAFSEAAQTGITKTLHDGVNIVAWSSAPGLDFNSNVLAITYSRWLTGDKSGFVDCDIIFNDQDVVWELQAGGDAYDAASVALHEIGHFIGLDHTTSTADILFPAYTSSVALSSDDQDGAQVLYPGEGGVPLPTDGPTVSVSASPASGTAPLNTQLTATAKAGSAGFLVKTYNWDFGDGSTLENAGPSVSHSYTQRGIYLATVTVADTRRVESFASVLINVEGSATVQKGTVNLAFGKRPRGTFSFTLQSAALVGIRAEPRQGVSAPATLFVAGLERTFLFNTYSGQSVAKTGPQLGINFANGRATVRFSDFDLPNALKLAGFPSDDGAPTPIPVGLRLGAENNVVLAGEVRIGLKKSTASGISGALAAP